MNTYRQIVGLPCVICGNRINGELGAQWCGKCGTPSHRKCRHTNNTANATDCCPECGATVAVLQVELERIPTPFGSHPHTPSVAPGTTTEQNSGQLFHAAPGALLAQEYGKQADWHSRDLDHQQQQRTAVWQEQQRNLAAWEDEGSKYFSSCKYAAMVILGSSLGVVLLGALLPSTTFTLEILGTGWIIFLLGLALLAKDHFLVSWSGNAPNRWRNRSPFDHSDGRRSSSLFVMLGAFVSIVALLAGLAAASLTR